MNTAIISTREQEVLELISFEFRTREIAKELYISMNTVQTHRKNLLEKMDVKNTAGLIRKGFELGYLRLGAMAC